MRRPVDPVTPAEVSAPRDAVRPGTLLILWLSSVVTYYVLLLRPYGLLDHLATPRLSLGVITGRDARAAEGFLLCFALTFLFYGLAYRICRDWRSERAAVACLGMGLLTAVLLALVYPICATDVFDYIVQGELLAVHDLNPLAYPPATVPDLPFLRYAAYTRAVSPYGPAWLSLQAAVIKVASPGDLLALTLGFKALAILGYLLACALIVGVLRRRAPQMIVAGSVAFAWNPLILTEVAVNAHNDIWIAALVLAGVLFWELRRPLLMLVSLTLALLIKAFAVPLLPLFAIAAWRQESSSRRLHVAIIGAAVVAALGAVPYLLLPQGPDGLRGMLNRTDLFTHSLPALAYFALASTMPQRTAAVLTGATTVGVLGGYFLLQLRNAWRQSEEVVRLAFNTLLFMLLLCMPWFQPWYMLSVMALGAVYPRPNAPFQAALSTACVVVSYVVYGFVWFWAPSLSQNPLGIHSLAVVTSFALPWAYAIWSGVRGRRPDAARA